MKRVVCSEHKFKLSIPTTDEEFFLGKMHDNIIQIQLHHKQFPNCKFEEIMGKY